MAAKFFLSALEVEEKMIMGLCFLCDKPFTLEHQKTAHRNVRFVVRDMGDEEVEQESEKFNLSTATTTPVFPSASTPSFSEPLTLSVDRSLDEGHLLGAKLESEENAFLEKKEGSEDKCPEATPQLSGCDSSNYHQTSEDVVVEPAPEIFDKQMASSIIQSNADRSSHNVSALVAMKTMVPSPSPRFYLPPKPPDIIAAPMLSPNLSPSQPRINFYSKCGYYTYACQLLDEMSEQDVVSFPQQHSVLSSIMFLPVPSRASSASAYLLSSSEMQKTPATIPPPEPPDEVTDLTPTITPSILPTSILNVAVEEHSLKATSNSDSLHAWKVGNTDITMKVFDKMPTRHLLATEGRSSSPKLGIWRCTAETTVADVVVHATVLILQPFRYQFTPKIDLDPCYDLLIVFLQKSRQVMGTLACDHLFSSMLNSSVCILYYGFKSWVGCEEFKNRSQIKGFLFDCVIEYLQSNFCQHYYSAFKLWCTWAKLSLSMEVHYKWFGPYLEANMGRTTAQLRPRDVRIKMKGESDDHYFKTLRWADFIVNFSKTTFSKCCVCYNSLEEIGLLLFDLEMKIAWATLIAWKWSVEMAQRFLEKLLINLLNCLETILSTCCDLSLAYNHNSLQGCQRELLCLIKFYNQLKSSNQPSLKDALLSQVAALSYAGGGRGIERVGLSVNGGKIWVAISIFQTKSISYIADGVDSDKWKVKVVSDMQYVWNILVLTKIRLWFSPIMKAWYLSIIHHHLEASCDRKVVIPSTNKGDMYDSMCGKEFNETRVIVSHQNNQHDVSVVGLGSLIARIQAIGDDLVRIAMATLEFTDVACVLQIMVHSQNHFIELVLADRELTLNIPSVKFDAKMDKESGGDGVIRSGSPLKQAVGERVLLFKNCKLHSLKWQKLIFILQYHEDNFISVMVSECQVCPVMAILHRKAIDWGQVHIPSVLLEWKTLPPKHGTWKYSSLRTRMFEGAGIVTVNKY